MTETLSIYRGDSTPPRLIGHRLDDGSLATLTGQYACRIKVAGTAIDRAVTTVTGDNKQFIAALTPAETATLAVGQHVLAIEIENLSLAPPWRAETHLILTIEEQIIGSSHVPAAETEVERLTREIGEIRAKRRDVALGKAIVEVWRDGRRVRTPIATLAEFDALVRTLEGELMAARIAAGEASVPARRSAIGVCY